MSDTVKEEKPKVGNILLKEGKANIITEDGPVKFDLDYVISLIKKATKASRSGFITDKIRSYAKILKENGLDGIDIVTPRMKVLLATKGVNKDFLKHISELLGKLKMFSKIKTAPPKSEEAVKEELSPSFVMPDLDLPEEWKGLSKSNHTNDSWHLEDNQICFGTHKMWTVDICYDKEYTVACVEFTGCKCLLIFDNAKEEKS